MNPRSAEISGVLTAVQLGRIAESIAAQQECEGACVQFSGGHNDPWDDLGNAVDLTATGLVPYGNVHHPHGHTVARTKRLRVRSRGDQTQRRAALDSRRVGRMTMTTRAGFSRGVRYRTA
ncbi:hypothetical protein ABIA39_002958 [Nocardia sp. GAS34]